MRVLRCRNEQRPGTMGYLLTAIGSVGGHLGEIKVIRVGRETVVRDITVFADDIEHFDIIFEAVRHTPGVELLEIRDEVLEMHRGGKIAVRSRYPVETPTDLRKVYTPGVAEVSLRIKENPGEARLYTAIPYLVAIVTDGSAVLGLGDVGPLASMPVMEGKATLMETLVGLSGMPVLLNTPGRGPDCGNRCQHRPHVWRDPVGGHFRTALFRDRRAPKSNAWTCRSFDDDQHGDRRRGGCRRSQCRLPGRDG